MPVKTAALSDAAAASDSPKDQDEQMSIFTSLFRRSQKRRSYADLLEMDDRLLRDIGLNRSDIHLMMNGTRTAHTKGHRAHE